LFQADDREVLRGFRRHHREDGGPKQAPVAVEDDNVLTRRDGEPEADRGRLGVTPDAVLLPREVHRMEPFRDQGAEVPRPVTGEHRDGIDAEDREAVEDTVLTHRPPPPAPAGEGRDLPDRLSIHAGRMVPRIFETDRVASVVF
jgi:hypothetical protein